MSNTPEIPSANGRDVSVLGNGEECCERVSLLTCEVYCSIDDVTRFVGTHDGSGGVLAAHLVLPRFGVPGVTTDTALATVLVPLAL